MTIRTLNRRGHLQATLDTARMRIEPIKLDPVETTRHVNAAMPTAPQNYPWPHMKEPARFSSQGGGKRAE